MHILNLIRFCPKFNLSSSSPVTQVADINVQTLISYTSFNDESGESPDRLVTFKRWLWATVEKMSPLEKQDLVYFWTGKKKSVEEKGRKSF